MKHRLTLFAAGLAVLFGISAVEAQNAPATNNASLPPVKALTMMAASIPCSDLDRSIAFYTKGLGMTLAGKVEMGTVTEAPLHFPGGGAYIILQHPKSADTPLPTRGMLMRIGMMVPDLKALEARLNAAGYKLAGKINEMPQYKVAVGLLQDPDGNNIELIQRMP